MGMKAIFSNRLYKHKIDPVFVMSMTHTLRVFNQAKHFRYQAEVRELRGSKAKSSVSIHQRLKQRYGLNDYYANSAVQEGRALLSAQKELKNMYMRNKKEQINAVKRKIKATKARLTTLQKIKASFVKGTPTFNKTSREQQKGAFFVVTYKHSTRLFYCAYDFEHQHLDVNIKHLKSRLGQLNFKQDRYENQLIQLTNKVAGVCFGSKKLARGRLTQKSYHANLERWQKDWAAARYGKMTISGRKDAKSGNFVFRYHPETHTLTFKAIDQCVIRLADVVFPYGQDHVNRAIQTQMNLKDKKKYGKPIGWSLEDHGAYYIVKCLIDVPATPYLNTSTSTGMIGVDLNVNHIAVANVNDIGQCVDAFTLPFNLEGKTSGQARKIIEAEVIALVDYAVKHHKPLAIEKLDTTRSKVSRPYGHKTANRRMSQFAYQKMILAIRSRAEKMGVAVYAVNPAYTSQIGKMKYMKRLGVSIHMAAAYVIARRAMGFKEKLPPMLYSLVPEQKQGLHHWAQWAYMTRTLSFVRTHAFYQAERFDQSKLCSWDTLFPLHALTDVEKIGLRRLESRKTYA